MCEISKDRKVIEIVPPLIDKPQGFNGFVFLLLSKEENFLTTGPVDSSTQRKAERKQPQKTEGESQTTRN